VGKESLRKDLAFTSLQREASALGSASQPVRRRAGISASNRKALCGAVGFIQRVSDALNIEPHAPLVALDGLYIDDRKGNPVFRQVGPPTDAEIASVAGRVHRRVMRLMQQRGLGPQADSGEADALRRDEPLLSTERLSLLEDGRLRM
jgi:hypothetical protein